MKKVTLAARFIFYWNMAASLSEAIRHVEAVFPETYNAVSFACWNTSIDSVWAISFFETYKDEPGIDLYWIVAALSEVR